uniref:Disease resistance protein RPM1-like isoform X1 n=1 Tax=Cymbidium sinense TaxID=112615 RepID=A0A5B8HAW1_9ASPA|nr:disease resistance protein RPM1-like isoform X1 [Cymbidium sinense]
MDTVDAVISLVIPKLCSLLSDISRTDSEVNWLGDELRSMRSFLEEVEDSPDHGDDKANFLTWINQIREAVYDSEDIIESFDLCRRLNSVYSFPCMLNSRHDLTSRIQDLRSRLEDISRRRQEYISPGSLTQSNASKSKDAWLQGLLASSPFSNQDGGEVVGFRKDLDLLLGWVLAGPPELTVVSVVGMGGLGKTTLVKRVFNHGEVRRLFDRSAWIYVSQKAQIRDILSDMAKRLMEFPTSEIDALGEQELQEELLKILEHRRILLVLDDVWRSTLWEAVKLVLPSNNHRSRVIITTRNEELVSSITGAVSHVHRLQPLSPEDSWTLFRNKAFPSSVRPPDELDEVAREIVRNCGGLPLAVVTIGGMMSRKEGTVGEWHRVLDNIHKYLIRDDSGDTVRRVLMLSYTDLPYPLKSCFLYFSLFPMDFIISRKRLVRLWLAEGFVDEEEVAEKYLTELISRSMVQVSMMRVGGRVKACQVHDLLHHLAITIAGKQSFSAFCKQEGALVSTIPNKTRRISFQPQHPCSCTTLKFHKGTKPLRSLFLFGIAERFSFRNQIGSFRLLRVIDLEEAAITKLSSEIGNLRHLRYLGLKGTKISHLPRTLKNLRNLQTLDVRRTQLRKLQFDVKNWMNLKHLEMRQAAQSIRVKSGIQNLSLLQVVTGLKAGTATAHRIGRLQQLRKLGVEKLKSKDANLLCCSINNMSSLVSLSISTKSESETLELGNLKPSPRLQKLHLVGNLTTLPDWLEGLQSLTKLRLGLSRLQEDPMPILGKLHSLAFLQLYDYAYEGKVMRSCRGGFKMLRILLVTGLEGLEEWEVEEGSMPFIQELWIVSCSNLKAVPSGFQFLATLQKLRLLFMPDRFLSRVSTSGSGGEDLSFVRHIASILSQ